MHIREYLREDGFSPFGDWYDLLDQKAAAKVSTAVARMEAGNLSNAKGIGSGFLSSELTGDPAIVYISALTGIN